ncbi:Fe-S cluster assembly protein SufD, partial [Escherichia coli]|nr:Fe-S cluster assembly protein SufD [Escherichia coli]
MAENMTIKDDFIHAFSSNANEPDWFLDIRRNAFKAYGELDLPFVD